MKPNELFVGARVWTHVSGSATECVITEDLAVLVADTGVALLRPTFAVSTKRYKLRRVDNGRELERLRSARALHPTPGPWGEEGVGGEGRPSAAPVVGGGPEGGASRRPLAK